MLKLNLIILIIFLSASVNETFACTKYFHRKGYSCFDIMNMFSLNYDQLIALNPGLNCYNLRYDQQICVYGFVNQPVFCNRRYYAKIRDSCHSIVRHLGVGLNRLMRCNNRLNCASTYFTPGQVLYY